MEFIDRGEARGEGAAAADGEGRAGGNIEGLIDEKKVRRDRDGLHLGAAAKRRRDEEDDEMAKLEAAEKRYKAMSYGYERSLVNGDRGGGREYSELEGELAEAARARAKAEREEAARHAAAERAAEASRQQQQRRRPREERRR